MMSSRTQIHIESIKMMKNENHKVHNRQNKPTKRCQEYKHVFRKHLNFGLNVVFMFQKIYVWSFHKYNFL